MTTDHDPLADAITYCRQVLSALETAKRETSHEGEGAVLLTIQSEVQLQIGRIVGVRDARMRGDDPPKDAA